MVEDVYSSSPKHTMHKDLMAESISQPGRTPRSVDRESDSRLRCLG